MLCGHTHNGQIVPFNRLVKRYFLRIAGRYEAGATVLYPALFTKDRKKGYGVPEICSKIMVLVQTAPQIHGARHERNHSAVFAVVQSGGVH